MTMLSKIATLLVVASAPLSAQDVLLARVDGPGVIDVVRVAAGASATLVDDLAPRRLDLLGVPLRDRLSALAPRPEPARGLVPAHVRLPSGTRVWRGVVDGRERFLRLGPGADVLELFAADPGDALGAGVALDADGGTLVGLVTGPAGERLALVDVAAGGATVVSVPGAAAGSLRVANGRAWCVDGAGGVHAIDVASGAVTSTALPLGAGEDVVDEIVVSADGSRAAVVVESAPTLRRILTVDAGGAVDVVTPTAGAYDLPSLTRPEGPLLAVSPDGARVAFRQTTPAVMPFRDVVVRSLAPAQSANVTSDADFIDTLNDVGVISFVAPDLVTFFLGEQAFEPGVLIEASDVYSVALDALGAPTSTQNLTGTSNDAAAPFTVPGALEVLDVARDPLGERLLIVVDPQGADGELLAVPADAPGAPVVVMSDLEQPPVLSVAGDIVIATAPASEDFFPSGTTRIDVLPPVAVGAPRSLGVVPPGIGVSRFASAPNGDELALVVSADAATELGVAVDVSSGAALPLAPVLLAWGAGLAYDAAGTLVAPVGVPGAQVVVAWSTPSSAIKLALPVAVWQTIDLH